MTQTLTPAQFVAKWSQIQQKETAVPHSHFNDVCHLVGHQTPLAYDPAGDTFSFETQAAKPDGAKGFADVFYREKFIWEYKGPHQDLDKAYQQLQLYREALENPPLLITSDIHTIIIHTNFNNYPIRSHTITFDDILRGDGVEKLTWAFFTPERFRPAKTRQRITKATADSLLRVADEMKKHRDILGAGSFSNEQLAHFLVRLLFAMFAEDMGLLPNDLFTKVVRARGSNYADLRPVLRELFTKMRDGGTFGMWRVRHFNGTLFDDDFVPDIPHDLGRLLLQAAEQDWSQVDPSIFGTLFERVIDEGKRAQLGAHYTSEDDIMLIVEPVLMAPLKRRWNEVRRQVGALLTAGADPAARQQASEMLRDFAAEIANLRLLDPSCGSGNFLYVGLRELLSLQKEVITFAARRELPPIELSVGPEQLYGIEINAYAHELAQITVWIGYLQWRHENGFVEMADPVLRPLQNIKRMDAILAYDDNGSPAEPEWPAAEVIIGNPPFLGGNKIRQELGDQTVDSLFQLYDKRIPAFADMVCYWFEKARTQIAINLAKRAGLIATNSIRGGANREVLKRIKETGDIFIAWSDNPWILDGAAVRVSIVGFDDASEIEKKLDGIAVTEINADLTSSIDLSKAQVLHENADICFMGPSPKGPFDISSSLAQKLLSEQNPNGKPNSDVVRPVFSATDIVRNNRSLWTIDFGLMSQDEAGDYKAPFQYVQENVYPIRSKNRRASYARNWWLYAENRPGMRNALHGLKRFIATPAVAKHRLFVFVEPIVLCNQGCLVFAREDNYFFGVLHSRLHEFWALRMGTWLGKGNDPRYTPTTTFETFPFPWPPGQEPAEADDPRVAAIGHWSPGATPGSTRPARGCTPAWAPPTTKC
jgi:type II restriction/modification system DNA methylase subunit YeeA